MTTSRTTLGVLEDTVAVVSFKAGEVEEKQSRNVSSSIKVLQDLNFIHNIDSGAGGWDRVEKRFDFLSNTDGFIPRSRFGECIGMDRGSNKFAGPLLDALARRMNILDCRWINKAQLEEFWSQITDQSSDSGLQIFFEMFDKDADGRISEDEIMEIISLSVSTNKLQNIQMQAAEYASLIMEELDRSGLGYITIDNLKKLLLQGLSQSMKGNGGSRKLSKMLSKKLKSSYRYGFSRRWYSLFQSFVLENWQRVWVMTLWIGLMTGLFVYKYIQYKHRAVYKVMGPCVCLAEGAAETLKLNMALILLPVCRNTITWLWSNTKLGVAIPFVDNLNFHKVIAVAIAIGTGMHSISYLACAFPRLLHATSKEYAPVEKYFGEQPKSYWHFIKDWEGVTGIIMVVLMAIAFTLASRPFRRNRIDLPKPLNKLKGFSALEYSHHLFIIFYACLIVHGIKLYFAHEWYKKTTWMYLAIPITLYAIERLIRAFRSSIQTVQILKVVVYPGNTVALHISKPQGFKYKSGQYIFVSCRAVSLFEWHPFYITSAPGDDYLSVHIRTLDWTRQLKTVFAQVCQPPHTGESGLLRDDRQGENNLNVPRVLIDGPYGALTLDYKEYDVLLLVGLGIGAAPMISIVKDMADNMKAMEEEEHALEEGVANESSLTPMIKSHHNFKTRRAYFYWVTREQGSFEWFKGVMNEVAEMDQRGAIEVHNYCTSVYEEGDARSALIAMVQMLNHAKNGVDIVSGTRTKCHFAKPNWRTVFERIALTHPNSRVGVLYGGAPVLVPELRQLASDFSHQTTTKFEFHNATFAI